MAKSKDIELFGGALLCKIPSDWRDVSQVRQVPDNQEVYQDCTENTGGILVVEILERQNDISNSHACSFFFRDLADSNGCSSPDETVTHCSQVMALFGDSSSDNENATNNDQCSLNKDQLFPQVVKHVPKGDESSPLYCCVVLGSQKVAQGKDTDAAGRTRNIESKWIDIELCALRLKNVNVDLLVTVSTPRQDNINSGELKYSDVFKEAISTFEIRDWSLFSG